MASQQDLLNQIAKLREELACTICTGVIDDPHVLVCGHTFCGVCILQWLPTKKICPVCRVAVMRQPVHVNMIQKLSDFFRALDNTKSVERLTRTHWKDLFPTETQATFIRDIDQDGIIHRCSQCGWELDEDNFCEHCQISFDGEINQTIRDDSDHASHVGQEEEEDLSGFVVNDDESIVYSDSSAIEINDSDEEHIHAWRPRQNRVIAVSDDDDGGETVQSESMYDIPSSSEQEDEEIHDDHFQYHGHDMDEDDIENEEGAYEPYEEDEEVEDRYQQKRSRFIDDYAEEDEEDEEEEPKPKETVLDAITQAIGKMNSSQPAQDPVHIDSSTDTSSDESDAPDYENMTAPLSSQPIPTQLISSQPIPSQPTPSQPIPSHSQSTNPIESTTKPQGNPQKKRKRRQKNKQKRKQA